MKCLFMNLVLTLMIISFVGSNSYADEPETGKIFKGSSTSIYYEVRGNTAGTPLFVLHGGPGFEHRYFHYSTAFDSISQKRKVIYYDQRGCGQSAPLKAGEAMFLKDQINDLEELRVHLGFEKIDLLGHSWGGFLAMAYAARYPEHISQLILCGSAAPKWSDPTDLFSQIFPESTARQNAVTFALSYGEASALETFNKEYLSQLFYAPANRESFLKKAATLTYSLEVNRALNQELNRFDLSYELIKYKFPTLVLTGRYDINVFPLIAYKIHTAIRDSQFTVFEQSGHLPFFEEPENFARRIELFLSPRQ